MNFIFISPAFPENYYLFCRGLKNNGVNVLGIGDTPYHELKKELIDVLTEYYYVPSLEDYDAKLRAVAFFTFKYGKIDYIESNNEYWLSSDAALRTDFNVTTGPNIDDVIYFRSKSKMKEKYLEANVQTARYLLITTIDKARDFIKEVGYPVVCKPDDGVGAMQTYKVTCDEELVNFFQSFKNNKHPYIMEEFIKGDLISFDDCFGRVILKVVAEEPSDVVSIRLIEGCSMEVRSSDSVLPEGLPRTVNARKLHRAAYKENQV